MQAQRPTAICSSLPEYSARQHKASSKFGQGLSLPAPTWPSGKRMLTFLGRSSSEMSFCNRSSPADCGRGRSGRVGAQAGSASASTTAGLGQRRGQRSRQAWQQMPAAQWNPHAGSIAGADVPLRANLLYCLAVGGCCGILLLLLLQASKRKEWHLGWGPPQSQRRVGWLAQPLPKPWRPR